MAFVLKCGHVKYIFVPLIKKNNKMAKRENRVAYKLTPKALDFLDLLKEKGINKDLILSAAVEFSEVNTPDFLIFVANRTTESIKNDSTIVLD